MTLEKIGYTQHLKDYRATHQLDSFEVGRISSEHKERYVVTTGEAEFDAELLGNLRFTAESRYDLPAVGDFVAISEYDEGKALIHAIYPRKSIIERRAAGKSTQVQIIATNIDYGLIVQAVDRDFNLNRLERYLIICHASQVEPIIVLNKTDLIGAAELEDIQALIRERIPQVPILMVNNTPGGAAALQKVIQKGHTYCLLGSSGVGKSTLLNNLAGKHLMNTREISSSVNKGQHTTSHRELIVLDDGGIIIDNPGMREVGIADTSGGLEITFEALLDYAQDCRYKDCTHTHELGCAILEAVDKGDIDEATYANFRKMQKEKSHFEADALERKKKDKSLGKLIKQVVKEKRNKRY